VAREVEDLQALIAQAGGDAFVYGISSGAALALAAAAAGPGVTKLALYEPPFMAARATADARPTAEHRTLDGQTHDVAPLSLDPWTG
jgi:pimeloyl-ACP methyl ester carboxylesterase